MYLFDTEHLSLLQRGNAEGVRIRVRLNQVPYEQRATTIVTYEEQMRGWLAVASKANTVERMVAAYARLQGHISTFSKIPILPFDLNAADEFIRLRQLRLRIGSMDLKIAAIALANKATLTRNVSDFSKVPDLQIDDWTH